MFSRFVTILPIAALVAVAAAAPNALEARNSGSNCNASNEACCNTNQLASGQTYNLNILSDVLGVLTGSGLNAGVTCSPVTVVGTSSACQQNQQAVCCDGNTFNGLVNVGCTAINISV